MDPAQTLLMTCYKYQFHGFGLIGFWTVQLIAFLSIYQCYIKSNQVKVQDWTKFVLFSQVIILAVIIGVDMYGYYSPNSAEKFFVIAPIVYSLLTTCQFCYLFFGLKLMIVEA